MKAGVNWIESFRDQTIKSRLKQGLLWNCWKFCSQSTWVESRDYIHNVWYIGLFSTRSRQWKGHSKAADWWTLGILMNEIMQNMN